MEHLFATVEKTPDSKVFRLSIECEDRDDPLHKERIVVFIETDGTQDIRQLWYDSHELLERSKPNVKWQLASRIKFQLSKRLKETILQNAAHAWWRFCFACGRDAFGAIQYWEDRVAPTQPAPVIAPGSTTAQ